MRNFTLGLIFCILATGCGEAPKTERVQNALPKDVLITEREPGKYGGVMVLAENQAPRTFHPQIMEDAYSAAAIGWVMASLLELDPIQYKIMPGLAKKWDISEDHKTYTFYLREGIKWSDGEPFSADDVIFTFDAMFDERYPNRSQSQFTIGGVYFRYQKINDYTIEIKTAKVYAPLLNDLMSVSILPKHKLHETYKNGTFQKAWSMETAINNPEELVGLGPYKVKVYLNGERIVYEPNPHFWKTDKKALRLPYIDFIIKKFVPDINTQMVLFTTGQTDVSEVMNRDLEWMKEGEKDYDYTIYKQGPSDKTSFIWFNMKPGQNKEGKYYVAPHKLKWFSDKRFRQAISYALDRAGIIKAVSLGRASPLTSIISPANIKWHNPRVKRYPRDFKKARDLLIEAGFRYRKDGKLEDEEENLVGFELLASDGSTVVTQILTTLKENLKAIGIRLKLSYVDFGTMLEKTGGTHEYEASMMAFTGGSGDPSDGKAIYRSNGRLHIWNPEQKRPATNWEGRIDELVELQEEEMDEERRIALIHELQEIFAEELPLIYLHNPDAYIGIKNKWQNIELPPMGSILWNIDEIWTHEIKSD